MTHVRDIDLEGTSYFLYGCRIIYMQARLGKTKRQKYLVLRENRIDRIVVVFHEIKIRAARLDANGPATHQENYKFILTDRTTNPPCSSKTCSGHSACGMPPKASSYRGRYGINIDPRRTKTPMASANSRPHQGAWHRRTRTISSTRLSTRHCSRSSQTSRMRSKRSRTCMH